MNQSAAASPDALFDALTEFVSPSPFTYLVVVGAVAFDAVLPLLPGEAVVLSAAVLAVEGELSLWLIVAAAAVGGFIGDSVTYSLGCKAGRPAGSSGGRTSGLLQPGEADPV